MKQQRHKAIAHDLDKKGEGPCFQPCPPLQMQFQLKQLASSNLQLETNFQDSPDHWWQVWGTQMLITLYCLSLNSNLGKLWGSDLTLNTRRKRYPQPPRSLSIIPMTFIHEKEQTAPGHTVITSKGETVLPGKQEVHRPWHRLQQWASMTQHFGIGIWLAWHCPHTDFGKRWLKDWTPLPPSFTTTRAATRLHWGIPGCWKKAAEFPHLKSSAIRAERMNPHLHHHWPEGDFQSKSSKTSKNPKPNQNPTPFFT